MKANLLIILTIVLIASACQINKEMLTFDNPTITIKDINVITSPKGKVICYTINLYSPSRLSEFVAIPDKIEKDCDNVAKFEFDRHVRRATVVYCYTMPDQMESKHVNIKFCLNNRMQDNDVAEISHSL